MKKFIIGFIILSLGIFAVFTFLGKNKGYDAEKVLWDINQDFNKIAADPQATPENAFNELSEKYANFIKKFPDAKVTPGAHILWARLMTLQKKYDRAKELYEEVIVKYPENKTSQLEALLEIGNVQTLQKDELGVLDTYQRVIKSFPTSEVGLKTPLLVAQYYLEKKQTNLMEKAFEEAIVHYNKLIKEHKGTPAGFYALQYLSVCYIAMKDWDGALSTYEQSLMDYSDLNVWTPQSLLKLVRAYNTIYATQKKSVDGPINLYKKFMAEHPEHAFNPILDRVIKTLEELKAKGAINENLTVQSLEKAVGEIVEDASENQAVEQEQDVKEPVPATAE